MKDKMRVIDLMAGLGGCSVAFKEAGFNIVYATDNDEENKKYYCNGVEVDNFVLDDLQNIMPESLPQNDIIISKLLSLPFSNIKREHDKIFNEDGLNKKVYSIITYHKPKYFVLEATVGMLNGSNREYVENILRQYAQIGYRVFYNVFQERDYSGFPVVGRKLFFIGINESLGKEDFLFSDIKYVKYDNIPHDDSYSSNIDDWYRNIKVDISDTIQGDYYINERGRIQKTDIIDLGLYKEMFVVDSIGVRRITHNELAILKGLPRINYNNCANKRRMYNKIARASNAYVVREIANSILFHYRKSTFDFQNEENTISYNEKEKKHIIKNKKKEIEKFVYPKLIIKNIHINHLKGLNNLSIDLEKKLVAIMGVNGVGKSTILHALACTYSRYENGNNHNFSFFFTPNPNAAWRNSKFSITYYDENEKKEITKVYKKDKNKWTPSRDKRPKRDVYYIGIETCIPEIEIEKQTTFINYSTDYDENKTAQKIIEDAADILNKDYKKLTLHKTKKKKLIGVQTISDVTYSSLSMGAGEQRVIKILDLVHSASSYSLILIDEIDLLLHITALKRLIKKLALIAEKRNLQIIFTTHSLVMDDLKEYVDIRYLENINEKTIVYKDVNPELIYQISNKIEKPIEIYVEDLLAEVIVQHIAKNLNMLSYITVKKFGAAGNAFVVAASYILKSDKYSNNIIILDGDVFKEDSDKNNAVKNIFSGTENDYDKKIHNVVSMIKQFNLPQGIAPEKYIYDMLIEMDNDNELVIAAKRMKAVSNSHEWLDRIVDRIGQSKERTLYDIIEIVSEHNSWERYIKDVRDWLKAKKIELKLE